MKSLFILLLSTPLFLFGQSRMVVTDPEIEFSYELPKSWRSFDDGNSLLLIPPSQFNDENLSITYFEADLDDLQKNFEMTLRYYYPLNEPNFELIAQGVFSSDQRMATWAIFDSNINGVSYRSYLFHFFENNQLFKIRGTARRDNFLSLKNQFEQISQSIESRRI